MAKDLFGRDVELHDRDDEVVAELDYARRQHLMGGDFRHENYGWHHDPVTTRWMGEKEKIISEYPAHLGVVNPFETIAGVFRYPDHPMVRAAVRRFEKGDYPLGTRFEDVLPEVAYDPPVVRDQGWKESRRGEI